MSLTSEKPYISSDVPNIGININRPMSWLGLEDWQNVYHYHKELELIFVDKGTLICGINQNSFLARQGDIVIFPSMTPHYTFTNELGSARSYIQFLESDFITVESPTDNFEMFLRRSSEAYFLFKAGTEENAAFKSCMDGIFEEYAGRRPYYESFICAAIHRLMACSYRYGVFAGGLNKADSAAIAKIAPSVKFMEESFLKKITLEDVSRASNLSPYYFCRLFKKATGAGFNDFLNFLRVKKTEELLCETDSSVAEIAAVSGFSSAPYFNYVFKKFKGLSPLQFRKSKHN